MRAQEGGVEVARMMNNRRRVGWLAAEFVVVVLGVAVGLGVDAWGTGRADVALEIGYLERLHADLQADTAAFRSAVRQDSTRSEWVGRYLAVVDGVAPFPADHLEVLDHLTASLMALFTTPRRDTYDELINQGDLGRIRSGTVREALAQYHADGVRYRATQFPEWDATAGRVELLLIERLTPNVYRWTQAASRPAEIADRTFTDMDVSRAEVQALVRETAADAELRNLLYRMALVQRRLAFTHETWAVEATHLLDTLDAELERLRRR